VLDLYTIGLFAVMFALVPQIVMYIAYAFLIHVSKSKSQIRYLYLKREAHDISFIIPVRREPLEYIERAIKRICELNIPNYEVIIISDDEFSVKNAIVEVVEKARRVGCNVWFIWRSIPKGARTGALNIGLYASKNPYVYIMDVDTYPEKCFLDIAVSILESNSEYACVVGRWGPLNYESRLSRALAAGLKYMTTTLYKARSILGLYTYPLGTGTLYRSDYLKEILKGWDESRVQDDMEIGARIMYAGFKVAYVDECSIYVENPSTYRAFRVQQYRWAYGALDTAITRARYIFRSNYPLSVKLEAYFYLLQYIPQVLTFLGSILLALLQFKYPFDYLAAAYPLLLLYIVAMIIHSTMLYREVRVNTSTTWETLTLMGRLAAVTDAISPYTLTGSLKAIFRIKTEYKRTPKGFYQRVYTGLRIPWELLIGLLFLFAGAITLLQKAILTAIFLLLHASAYLYVVARFPRDVFYK
jgi:cellulose synthase/poly-beta-1,6-N-acetylglucosamine synthase-like glycosyltransferase